MTTTTTLTTAEMALLTTQAVAELAEYQGAHRDLRVVVEAARVTLDNIGGRAQRAGCEIVTRGYLIGAARSVADRLRDIIVRHAEITDADTRLHDVRDALDLISAQGAV